MDDVPTLFIAILGGVLQKVFSPKVILVFTAVPGILSWVFLALASGSVPFLLLSRASAGLANGLLLGNIYLSNVASYQFLGSFKIIEVILLSYCILYHIIIHFSLLVKGLAMFLLILYFLVSVVLLG